MPQILCTPSQDLDRENGFRKCLSIICLLNFIKWALLFCPQRKAQDRKSTIQFSSRWPSLCCWKIKNFQLAIFHELGICFVIIHLSNQKLHNYVCVCLKTNFFTHSHNQAQNNLPYCMIKRYCSRALL